MKLRLASRDGDEPVNFAEALGLKVDREGLCDVPDDTTAFLAVMAGVCRFEVIAPGDKPEGRGPAPAPHWTLLFHDDYD